MVKKENLLKFLNDNDLTIVWTIIGEKQIHTPMSKGEDFFGLMQISGYTYLNNVKIENLINDKKSLVNDLDTQLNDLQLSKINLDIDLENTKKLRDDVKNDTNKTLEEKKKNYEDITKQQKQIRTLRQVYTNKEKSIRDLKNEILNDIKEILENSKKLLGYDEQKLQQNIFQKLNFFVKFMDLL